jgi:large subunit ribosomal protein L22e
VIFNFSIDCAKPLEDGIFDLASFEKFLHDKIKVDGKAGDLGNAVKVVRNDTGIAVTAHIKFSKRYLKYLTKKFLKKQQLRNYIRVVASSKNAYALRYLDVATAADEEEVDEE